MSHLIYVLNEDLKNELLLNKYTLIKEEKGVWIFADNPDSFYLLSKYSNNFYYKSNRLNF